MVIGLRSRGVKTSLTSLTDSPGILPPPITYIWFLTTTAARPCLAVGIDSLTFQVLLAGKYCSLFEKVPNGPSPPNTKTVPFREAPTIPPLFEGIGAFLVHLSDLGSYSSFTSILLMSPPCLPPITYILPFATPEARCSLGVGIGAFVLQESVAGSYASFVPSGMLPGAAPPTAYRIPSMN